MLATTAAARPQPAMSRREFVVLLALVQALQALAIDAMLPALGVISDELGVADANRRQLVIGVFLLSSGLSSLVPGALADRYGRKPVLLVCLCGYIATMGLSAMARDFTLLIVARALAGACASGMSVLPLAIIRDRFEGNHMARLQSLISVIFMVVPMIAPTLGQAVLLVAGWRWIFGLMAAMAALLGVWIVLRLPETLHQEYRQPVSLGTIATNVRVVLSSRVSIGYVLASSLVFGAMFGYINSAEQLVAEHFGAGRNFPYVFGGMALMMALANFTNSTIVERFGARRLSHTALLGFIVMALVQLWFAREGETLWQFVPLMTLNMAMLGFMGANFSSIGLQPFARIAGSAAAVQVFIRLVVAAGLGVVVGQAYDGTARPFATALVLAGLFSLPLVLFSERGRLFRRLNYPGQPAPTPAH